MKCLCCGKPILDTADTQELSTMWHTFCVKKFFGTKKLPDIEITEEERMRFLSEV